jgi:hypothetical protein
MAEAALVETDIEASRALVAFLETHGFPLKAALWVYQSDAERWRFMVCPGERRQDPSSFYRDFAKAINAAGSPRTLLGLDRVDIIQESSPFVDRLGKVYRVDSGGSLRLTNNVVNGVFLEDALILKLAA